MFLFPHSSFSYLCPFLLIIPLPFSLSFYLTDSNPLLSFDNQVREVHLYTENHRRGMYLQMNLDGRVSGSDAQTPYSVLELKSVKPGHIAIKGRSSSLFLCMDSGGRLRGQGQYSDADCAFRELLLADGYTRFLSSYHRFPVSLASRHSPDQHSVPFTRFLPLRNTLTVESVSEQPPNDQRYFNMDSDDLLGMGLNMVSPQLSVDK
ncbi:fibroblast growth factor 21-like [Epinephelus lanceolatus]|uniref:fibroblast growth factor 21-like isoform X1 n=2 Tax=Epinephelus lanceolatus TaxID=310571 RepID=UPI001446E50B|nr:fibroblast growth factor 21-like isoform X1 [Epinephelus lanceolatus]